jgi:hypothetical protein
MFCPGPEGDWNVDCTTPDCRPHYIDSVLSPLGDLKLQQNWAGGEVALQLDFLCVFFLYAKKLQF